MVSVLRDRMSKAGVPEKQEPGVPEKQERRGNSVS